MSSLLRIDASSREEGSHSRSLCDYFEKEWRARRSRDKIRRRDLVKTPIPHIDAKTIEGFYTPPEQFTRKLQKATSLSDKLIAELMAADTILISTPIYNFSTPSALKAYIDQIVRIGHTFTYDGAKFTGLVTGKRAFVFCAYGAAGYTNNGPMASYDFLQPYLKLLLGFLGIEAVHVFSIEGMTGDASSIESEIARVQGKIDAFFSSAAFT